MITPKRFASDRNTTSCISGFTSDLGTMQDDDMQDDDMQDDDMQDDDIQEEEHTPPIQNVGCIASD
eukprot:2412147-Prymnesium_polylepis.2